MHPVALKAADPVSRADTETIRTGLCIIIGLDADGGRVGLKSVVCATVSSRYKRRKQKTKHGGGTTTTPYSFWRQINNENFTAEKREKNNC